MTDLTAERLRELFNYDPDTGVFTRLKYSGQGRRDLQKPGTKAGNVNPGGRGYVGVDRRMYRSSRLAFFWMTGEWPKQVVDHINGDPSDDRWANLRDVSQSLNLFNRPPRRRKSDLPRGVQKQPAGGGYLAKITISKRVIYLGTFRTPEEAGAAYLQAVPVSFSAHENRHRLQPPALRAEL